MDLKCAPQNLAVVDFENKILTQYKLNLRYIYKAVSLILLIHFFYWSAKLAPLARIFCKLIWIPSQQRYEYSLLPIIRTGLILSNLHQYTDGKAIVNALESFVAQGFFSMPSGYWATVSHCIAFNPQTCSIKTVVLMDVSIVHCSSLCSFVHFQRFIRYLTLSL